MRRFIFVLAAAGGLAGCDRRPIDAAAALPAPGQSLPAFALPALEGPQQVAAAELRGKPVVIALWSTHCPFQGPAMAAFDSLAREFGPRGVQFVLLADDPAGAVLDSTLAAAPWRPAASLVGVANGRLAKLFDRSDVAPREARYRVEFVLPSFLLVDAEGRVVSRAFGAAGEAFRPALDSLASPISIATDITPAT